MRKSNLAEDLPIGYIKTDYSGTKWIWTGSVFHIYEDVTREELEKRINYLLNLDNEVKPLLQVVKILINNQNENGNYIGATCN